MDSSAMPNAVAERTRRGPSNLRNPPYCGTAPTGSLKRLVYARHGQQLTRCTERSDICQVLDA